MDMHTTETNATAGAARRASRIATPAALLWASAFLLAALTIVQAGRLPINAAYASAANQGNQGMSVITQNTGLGPDTKPYEALWVLDSRGEMLFIYYVENVTDKRLQLRWSESLPKLFRQARGN